ncbi:MAG: tyrosine recombinase XerC [Clostridia bacterium]|nr:tyrosine recombinase XerC [Clostridia bacterium]
MINIENNPEFLNSFLDYIETILNKSANTVKEYNYDLINFLKFIKLRFKLTTETDFEKIIIRDMTIEDLKRITLDDLHAYLSYLTRNFDSKPATRARKVSSIKALFNYLTLKTNLLELNPAQNLESPKIGKRMPKYLTEEESIRLLSATTVAKDQRNVERDYAIITIFLNCGIRLSELVGINIKDISFEENKLTVIGKGNKERTIYLNNACVDAIKTYLSVRPHDMDVTPDKKPLFLSERKKRISQRTVQVVVKNELQKAGLDTNKYSVHKLRHTAATLMYQNGVDIRALQELLGHESISTTEIYTHVENRQIRAAVEQNPLANTNFIKSPNNK